MVWTFLSATAAAQHVVALQAVEDLILGNGEAHRAHHADVVYVVAATAAHARDGKVVGSRCISKGFKIMVFQLQSFSRDLFMIIAYWKRLS